MLKKNNALLKIENLKKNYGETKALTGVNFSGKAGTVHTIFGENGSGKSTIVKILSGIIKPDMGHIVFQGENIELFTPRNIQYLGIVPVLQEILVAPNLDVLDNIFLGHEVWFKKRLSKQRKNEMAAVVLQRITNKNIPMDSIVGNLPLSERQLVVIARALLKNPQIIILDESTATLDIEERKQLFQAVDVLKEKNSMILFISHRIDEVLEISDYVTVLRNGMTVATMDRKELTVEKLLEHAS